MAYRKYRNKPVEYFGIKFHSTAEGDRYLYLRQEKIAGRIKNLVLQPKFRLQDAFILNEEKHEPIDYIADFRYTNKDGIDIIEDVKGVKTEVYRIKKKLFLKKYGKEIGKFVEVK